MSDNAPITPPIFDGHNDILSLLYDAGLSMDAPVDIDRFITGMSGHLDADKMRKGGFAGWLFCDLGAIANRYGCQNHTNEFAGL